jgi:hypothetical protein
MASRRNLYVMPSWIVNRWWWPLLQRAVPWTFIGAVHGAMMGALCGAVVCCALGQFAFDREEFVLVVAVGTAVGAQTAILPGALLFLVLNFCCPAQRGFYRPPLRLVTWGMILGAALSSLNLVLVWPLVLRYPPLARHIPGPDTLILSVADIAPACMVLGQILGGVATVLALGRKRYRSEHERWNRILESDYDVFQVSRSR